MTQASPRSEDPAAVRDAEPATPTAFELDVLYRSERHTLVRFFTRYRATPDDARDLVQEAFLRLARMASPPRCAAWCASPSC